MKLLRFAVICLIVFALLITAFSFLIPSRIQISKATDINASKDSIITLIFNPVNWKKWYPGADTASLIYINGKVKGVGDKQSGKGILIDKVTDSTVEAINNGARQSRLAMGWNIIETNRPNTITVQWYMNFKLRWYPWEKFSSLLLEKRYGPVMEKGLSNLKRICESE